MNSGDDLSGSTQSGSTQKEKAADLSVYNPQVDDDKPPTPPTLHRTAFVPQYLNPIAGNPDVVQMTLSTNPLAEAPQNFSASTSQIAVKLRIRYVPSDSSLNGGLDGLPLGSQYAEAGEEAGHGADNVIVHTPTQARQLADAKIKPTRAEESPPATKKKLETVAVEKEKTNGCCPAMKKCTIL